MNAIQLMPYCFQCEVNMSIKQAIFIDKLLLMNKLLCIPKDFLDEYDAYPILIQQLPNIISDLSYS